jgi:MerR family transcriptional regulator, light-induced transcriptional regulator
MSQYSLVEPYQDVDGEPIYNMKAVVEATGISAATLRAWERRYGALSPGRTDSGYRLYSARDIAVLRWLKARVDEGMSISQAIGLLAHRRPQESNSVRPAGAGELRGPRDARESLLGALTHFDEGAAERVLEEAFAVYGLESVAEQILTPAMVQIGQLWHEGRASTAAEHFATNYLRRKLDAIINAAPQATAGPLVVLGCGPGDWHELGLLLIHLMLRRRSVNTIYLGQNVPLAQFVEEMERLKPAIIVMGATTVDVVPGLIEIGAGVQAMPAPRPIFAFGGRVFVSEPELRTRVPGVFLGEDARTAVDHILALISGAPPAEPGPILRIRSAGGATNSNL